jgi:hypothetical protein
LRHGYADRCVLVILLSTNALTAYYRRSNSGGDYLHLSLSPTHTYLLCACGGRRIAIKATRAINRNVGIQVQAGQLAEILKPADQPIANADSTTEQLVGRKKATKVENQKVVYETRSGKAIGR